MGPSWLKHINTVLSELTYLAKKITFSFSKMSVTNSLKKKSKMINFNSMSTWQGYFMPKG